MASLATQFLVFLFVCGAIPIGIFAQELESNQDCELYCDANFKTSAARSCGRGCRFFVITKFLSPTADLRALCKASCEDAYGINDPDFLTCDTGCGKQLSITGGQTPARPTAGPLLLPQDSDVPSATGEGLQLHMMRPVMQVQRVVASVMCNLRVLKKSVLTYFMRDDNTIMAVESSPEVCRAVESSPEVMLEISPMNEDECGGGGGEPSPAPRSEEDSANRDSSSSSWSLENLNPFSSRVYDASVEPALSEETVTRVSLHDTRYTYLLHLLLLLAAVSLSLLALSYCFAVARHQRRQAAKATNLAVAVQSEPLKLVRPEELTKLTLLEDDQAGPLPHKHDLALTHATV
ncbi:hypothetical protein FHG87_015995 [Trinorchestia longiramus]|nr:hypothetical protein FHG87_015995 [Trinorchestia longiramus]